MTHNLTMVQAEALLKEASMEYIKTGANHEEVAYYATIVRELAIQETNNTLN